MPDKGLDGWFDKYFKFKQLQGAGFNDQVRLSSFSFIALGLFKPSLGAGNSIVSSSCSTNESRLCISASHMASTR